MNSCEEGPTKIGNRLLPGGDFAEIASTDTLSVFSYTMYDESVRTDNSVTSYLGQIYDPYFGTTTAEFVTQIRMSQKWDNLPFIVDSVKLFLKLLDVKGGSDVSHTLKLSEIAEQIYTDSAYYSNKPVLKADPVNDILFKNNFDINLPVLKPDTINNIVLNLPKEFGNYLTRDTTKLFYDNNKPDFRSFFKGLYFQMSSSSDPLFVTLSIAAPSSGSSYSNYIVVYMHNEDNVEKDFFFIIDAVNTNASYNRFSHKFNTAMPGKKIEHIDSLFNGDGYRDTLSYLQCLNGVYTRLVLPGLENIKSNPSFKHIAVNKARLNVPIYLDGGLFRASTVPSQLYLRYRTSSSSKYVVPDYNLDQYHAFFDGKIDSTANLYKFNIAAFVQGYLDDASGNVKPELEIFQETGTKNVILKANNSKTPVKFEFTYTTF
jgi:hypothetical protein